MSLKNSSNFLRFFSGAEMNGNKTHSYRFKSFTLNVAERQLLDADKLIPLTPKSFDTLVYLVERSGHLIEKEELMQSIWTDSFVEEGNLARIVQTSAGYWARQKRKNIYRNCPEKGVSVCRGSSDFRDRVECVEYEWWL